MSRAGKQIGLYVAAFIAGAVTPAGFAPFSLAFLPYFSIALLFYFWLRAQTTRQSLLLGFCFALGLFGTGASWVYVSLHTFGNMAAPLAAVAVFLFVAMLSLFGALAGWIQHQFVDSPVWMRLALVMPASWVSGEWLRGWILTGFPWLSLGYSQVEWLPGSLSPVLGVYGVSMVTAMAAGLLVLLIRGSKMQRLASAMIAAALFAIVFSLNTLSWVKPSGEPFRASLVQGNVPILEKWRPESRVGIIKNYFDLSSVVNGDRSDLYVWPEGAVPDYVNSLGESFWSGLRSINSRGGSVIFGGVEFSQDRKFYNSAVLVPAGDYADTGSQLASAHLYRKKHLVPFGDYFPLPDFLLGILDYLHIPMSDFSSWVEPQPLFSVKGHKVAVTICYEDAFGEELLPRLPEAELLVNISEDGWFGDSIGPLQRVQMAQMRARETGRPVIRSANTGVTGFIDHRGKLVSRLPQYTEDTLTGDVQPMSGATPYVRWGNLPILMGIFAILLIGWLFYCRCQR